METRFTFKDFFLIAFLTVLLVILLITMYMIDRQWLMMSQLKSVMQEQASDMRNLNALVRSLETRAPGAHTAAPAGPSGVSTEARTGIPDAFQRAYNTSKLPDYKTGDWLVSAFGVNLKTITPLISSDVYASQVQSYVQESLIQRDPQTLEWVGLIAKDWSVSEDGLTITFRMRDDVTFSDGKPLTAQDVVFSYNFIMNEAIAAPRERAYFEKIASVVSKSDYEVVFQFKEPYFNSLSLAGTMLILPQHFYQEFLKSPEKFNQSKGLLLGSGPYRLSDPSNWTPDKGLVELERNPRYWGPVLPTFDRILWKVIENDSARLTTFRNRDIDDYGARPREYQKLRDDTDLMGRTHQFEYMSPTAGYSYIGWNQLRNGKPTRFADKNVRLAMTYLTDRQRIIQDIMLGYAEVAVSPFNPRSPQHDPALTARSFDLSKAKELLQQSGYQDRNNDGILDDAQGKPFEFELVYFQDNEDTKRIVLLLKDLYARAGILLRPKPTEWSVMLDLLNKKDYDAITLGWSSGIETDIYQMFHSSQTVSGGDNFINYKNTEFDTLMDKARATVDESKRMELWHQCEKILYEEQPYTFLMRRKTLAFIDKRIHNLEITNLGLNLSSVPIEVYVPAGMQKYTQ